MPLRVITTFRDCKKIAMAVFPGFTSSESFVPLPESLIRDLSSISDLNELKIILYVIWRVNLIEGKIKKVSRNEISLDYNLMKGFANGESLRLALEKAVHDGYLLTTTLEKEDLFFLNSPGGKISLTAIQGKEEPIGPDHLPPNPTPNIFSLYEQNIGPLTPMMSETLIDAEKTYSAEWVADAMEVAVKMNKRNFKYIEAIMRRWKEEGRAKEPFRRDTKKSDSPNESLRKVQDFLKPRSRK